MVLKKDEEVKKLRFTKVEGFRFEGSLDSAGENRFSPDVRDISRRGYERLTVTFEVRDCGVRISFYAAGVEERD